MKWALIGVGHIGSTFVEGWIKAGYRAEDIFIKEYARAKEKELQEQYGVSILLDPVQLDNCDLVLFAVKPQDLSQAISELSPHIRQTMLVISIAAGINLASLNHMLVRSMPSANDDDSAGMNLPDEFPLLRVLPNLPAKVGAGISVMVANEKVSQEQLENGKSIFRNLGQIMELPEEGFAAVTALSGSGPAFVAVFIEALADAAVYEGLQRQDAYVLATQTLLGTAKLLQESKIPPSILKDQVSTAAGTSIYGIRALEKSGFRDSIFNAIIAASRRTRELAAEATNGIE